MIRLTLHREFEHIVVAAHLAYSDYMPLCDGVVQESRHGLVKEFTCTG